VPTIDLPADELAALIAALRGLIQDDRYPHAPRLDPLRAALARLEAATATNVAPGEKTNSENREKKSNAATNVAPPPAKADKRGRRGHPDILPDR
jgi:hypothetical protein